MRTLKWLTKLGQATALLACFTACNKEAEKVKVNADNSKPTTQKDQEKESEELSKKRVIEKQDNTYAKTTEETQKDTTTPYKSRIPQREGPPVADEKRNEPQEINAVKSKEEKASTHNEHARKRDKSVKKEFYGKSALISPIIQEEYDASSHYKQNAENTFLTAQDTPLSTFSIDVDTAAYTNTRRWLNDGQLPNKGVVRTEEFINYFTYDYSAPDQDNAQPFSVYTEAAACPWNAKHQILQIGLKGKELKNDDRKNSNLVFLIDVSGSMNNHDKLPLLRSGMKMLVNQLNKNDKVTIVVYAGASGVALEPTSVSDKQKILAAIDMLSPGGSTNGAAGIHLAYQLAEQNFIKEGNNRVILATDGDFNVGTTSVDQLQSIIEEKRESGVFLSVLGFGRGNLNDNLMETLANKGNGNYNYIDRLSEAQKVLVEQLNATLFTIAKDVKIQIEFNPEHVSHYRLIGYENRLMAAQDFNDDKKDAGEIGAGHTVTALYEIVPTGVESNISGKIDELKYQPVKKEAPAIKVNSNELLTLKIRYKNPTEDKSTKQVYTMLKSEIGKPFTNAKNNLAWATATAAFAQKLNNSNFLNEMTWDEIETIAKKAKGPDQNGYRGEMIQLIKLAKSISN